jgi:NitT/TauT family transport system substrate-binding protein
LWFLLEFVGINIISGDIGLRVFILVIILCLFGCSRDVQNGSEVLNRKVRIASLVGPTGMSLAELMENHGDEYAVHLVTSPDQVIPQIISGGVDIAMIPSNLAAVLYNKGGGNFSIVGVCAKGVLYAVGKESFIDGIASLKNSKKIIYSSGQGATPEYVLNEILKFNGIKDGADVTVRYLPQHADLANQIASGTIEMAILPEPFVSTVLHKNKELKVVLDLNKEWKKVFWENELPMGVVVVQNKFAAENVDLMEKFMVDFQNSVDFITNNVEEASVLMEKFDIISNKEIAVEAIPRCALCFVTGEKSRKLLDHYFEVLYKVNPKAIGGQLPGEEIYYKR